ncbi:hypothetical protein AYI70_g3722 [Smittium culicis]|uniref:Uncharacterized protein n=1 Tax=Smittium culicis TaxID=133412 RepID=A0A1R1Y288_9FUNG|nr:hypothetical protein AYI70_g3722 [Smittium culicis]
MPIYLHPFHSPDDGLANRRVVPKMLAYSPVAPSNWRPRLGNFSPILLLIRLAAYSIKNYPPQTPIKLKAVSMNVA